MPGAATGKVRLVLATTCLACVRGLDCYESAASFPQEKLMTDIRSGKKLTGRQDKQRDRLRQKYGVDFQVLPPPHPGGKPKAWVI